jgi:hypothetical protein
MPVVESSVEIRASREALFALTQDYYVRLEWDPFLRDLRFLDGATGPAPGVRVWVRARNGLSMLVEYVTVAPPERVAVKLVRGPFFFESFAGAWVFHAGRGPHPRRLPLRLPHALAAAAAPARPRRLRRVHPRHRRPCPRAEARGGGDGPAAARGRGGTGVTDRPAFNRP